MNGEPYFNEAGYESRRALPESVEKSRRYNEMALIRSVENLTMMARNPPAMFVNEIRRHLRDRATRFDTVLVIHPLYSIIRLSV